jgi:thioredoxin reductase
MARFGIRVIETPIARLAGADGNLQAVHFNDGTVLPRTVLYFSPGQHQRSSLAEQLGCKFSDEDGCIHCDEKSATCVPGCLRRR